MKVGDLVRWRKPPRSIGLVVDIYEKGVIWYHVLWYNGKQNSNPKWQMEVISESR